MSKAQNALRQGRIAWRNGLTNRFFDRTGYTGKILEREILGECRVGCDGYMQFTPAMKLAEKYQPHPTNNPPPEVSNFHRAVADKMGIHPCDLHLFTAVGTALDVYHGIDGWFRYGNHTVTVDVTMNRHKDSTRADVLVTEIDATFGYDLAATEIAEIFGRRQRHAAQKEAA